MLTFLKSGNSLPFVPNTQGTLAVLSALHTEDFHPSEKEREKNIFLIINNVSKRLMTCYDIKQIICMILPNARQINRCFFLSSVRQLLILYSLKQRQRENLKAITKLCKTVWKSVLWFVIFLLTIWLNQKGSIGRLENTTLSSQCRLFDIRKHWQNSKNYLIVVLCSFTHMYMYTQVDASWLATSFGQECGHLSVIWVS